MILAGVSSGAVTGALIVVGALVVGAVAHWSWPVEPKWLRDLERRDRVRREAQRVLNEESR